MALMAKLASSCDFFGNLIKERVLSQRLNGSVVIEVLFPSSYKLNDKFTRVEV